MGPGLQTSAFVMSPGSGPVNAARTDTMHIRANHGEADFGRQTAFFNHQIADGSETDHVPVLCGTLIAPYEPVLPRVMPGVQWSRPRGAESTEDADSFGRNLIPELILLFFPAWAVFVLSLCPGLLVGAWSSRLEDPAGAARKYACLCGERLGVELLPRGEVPLISLPKITIPYWFFREIWITLRDATVAWHRDNAYQLAAALAFYTTFSLAPALVVGVAVAGTIIGRVAAQTQLSALLQQYMGPQAQSFLLSVLETSQGQMTGQTATLIGIGTMLFGTTIVFVELKSALNHIWNVKPPSSLSIWQWVRTRLISFLLVLGIGAFLVLSLVASTAIAIISEFFSHSITIPTGFLQTINFLVSFFMVTILCALMYRSLPDGEIAWKDMVIGSAITSLLFTIGKWILAMYLASSVLRSVYGAAGSLVMILVWVYYCALVVLFGAELTKVYARRYGAGLGPPKSGRDENGTPRDAVA